MQPNVSHPLKKSQQPQRSQVSYILCQKMFTRSVQKEVISNLNLDVEPLELLVNIISERHKYPLDTYALEFYSQEGYPLCVNDYNQKCKFLVSVLYNYIASNYYNDIVFIININ